MQKFTLENNVFGRNMANLRRAKGVSARKMSLTLGQNPGYVNNIETGKAYPSVKNLVSICDYLNCLPEDLMYDKDAVASAEAKRLSDRIEKLDFWKRRAIDAVLESYEKK